MQKQTIWYALSFFRFTTKTLGLAIACFILTLLTIQPAAAYLHDEGARLVPKQAKAKPAQSASYDQPIVESVKRPLPYEPVIPSLNIVQIQPPDITDGVLMVPAINLEEPIMRVLVRNGEWDISQLGAQVGHLQTTGEHPGDGLAMTFVGHNWTTSGPFNRLVELSPGSEIIYRWQGVDFVYTVDLMQHVSPYEVGTLYEENGEAIVLATCSGLNVSSGIYETRLVMRAVLVEQRPSPPTLRTRLIQ